jgi:hypothetical protein
MEMKINFLKLKRLFKLNVGKLKRAAWAAQEKPRRPKNMCYSELSALTIYMRILRLPETKLYYDIKTQECFLKSEEYQLYLFLEERNLKIINSVFGYDVRVSPELEAYMADRFVHEMAIRRSAFKAEALSKVDHSLELTVDRVLKKSEPNGEH